LLASIAQKKRFNSSPPPLLASHKPAKCHRRTLSVAGLPSSDLFSAHRLLRLSG
jgi:hypothetical protein